jgi:branched-chain amino acid transport system ATP-binding protein
MDSVAQRLSAVGTGAALELRGVTRMFGALAGPHGHRDVR